MSGGCRGVREALNLPQEGALPERLLDPSSGRVRGREGEPRFAFVSHFALRRAALLGEARGEVSHRRCRSALRCK